MASQKMSYPNLSNLRMGLYVAQKEFAHVIKDFEMGRLSYIIQMDPKMQLQGPCKRQILHWQKMKR